jgi:hypothetical protein
MRTIRVKRVIVNGICELKALDYPGEGFMVDLEVVQSDKE